MMDVVKNFDAVDANKVSCVVLVVLFQWISRSLPLLTFKTI